MKTTILALASAAAALATAATALAEEVVSAGGGDTPETQTPAGGEAPKRRGRPPGSGAATTEPAAPTGASAGKSLEELREVIKPLVEEGRGEDVKKVIAKYGASLKEIPSDKVEAFVKDIDALKY